MREAPGVRPWRSSPTVHHDRSPFVERNIYRRSRNRTSDADELVRFHESLSPYSQRSQFFAIGVGRARIPMFVTGDARFERCSH